MKKLLMVLGGIFGLILLLLIGLIGYGFYEGPQLDAESKAWVDSIVPKVATTWDAKVLIENGSPELLETASVEEFDELMTSISTELGAFKKYGESQGEAGIHINNGQKTITAEYRAWAEYEKGVAQITIRGIKREDSWKILNFHVNLPKMPGSNDELKEAVPQSANPS
jgi:hypothetical protein